MARNKDVNSKSIKKKTNSQSPATIEFKKLVKKGDKKNRGLGRQGKYRNRHTLSRPFYLTKGQIYKNKYLMKAILNAKTEGEKHAILRSLKDDDFNVISKCMNNILFDRGPLKGKINDENFSRLKDTVKPYKRKLKRFAAHDVSVRSKKSLLRNNRKQKGGGLSDVISSLLPLALAGLNI